MFGEDYTSDEEQYSEQPQHGSTMTRLGISDEALRSTFGCEPTISNNITGHPFTYADDTLNLRYDEVTINTPLYRSQGNRAVALYMLTYHSNYQETLTGKLIIPVVGITSNLYAHTPEYPEVSYEVVDIFNVYRNPGEMRCRYSLRQSPDHHWGKWRDEEPAPFSERQAIGYHALMGLLGLDYQSNRTAIHNLISSLDQIYDLTDTPSNLEHKHWDSALTDYFKLHS